jgi:hypothetical protein
VLVGLWLIWTSGVYAETAGRVPVASTGKTSIVATSAKVRIQVVVTTHEVNIKEEDREKTDIPATSCTYARYPCSVLDNLSIVVNEKQIIVPRGVFLDLADINTAEVTIKRTKYLLRLEGGDASESYLAVIEFDGKRVKSKRLYSGEGNGLLQETVYHLVVEGY